MKRYLRIFSLIIAVVFFLASNSALLSMPANATSADGHREMTDETVRVAVAAYFDARADYLLGRTSAMNWLVAGIPKDEQKHLAHYTAVGIVPVQTTYTIYSLDPSGCCAIVFAVETLTYDQNGQHRSEEILHELRLYPNGMELPLVSADCYAEVCSGFFSCSYLPPCAENALACFCSQRSCTHLWSNDSIHLIQCDLCGELEWMEHQYPKAWQYDSMYHWQTCKCGKAGNYALHTMTGDGLTTPKTCSVCGFTGAYGEIFSGN